LEYYKQFSDSRTFKKAFVGRRGGGYPDLGPYSQTEVISALRKEIKLADVDKAIFWAHIMLEYGDDSFVRKACRQLVVMSAEDLHDDGFTLESTQLMKAAKAGTITHEEIYDAVARACKMEKWWETEYGRSVDYAWGKAQGEYARGERKIPNMETVLLDLADAIHAKDFDESIALTHVVVDMCGDVKIKTMLRNMLKQMIANGDYVDGCDIRGEALSGLASNGIAETDMFYFLVGKMVKGYDQTTLAPTEVEWKTAQQKAATMTFMGNFYEMPMYAVDQHTLRGAMMKRRGERIDNRFNGTEAGRAKTCWIFMRDGKLDRNAQIDDDGQAFVNKTLRVYGMGYSSKDVKMSPNTSTQLRLV
jgi:hypothetical protein